MPFPIPPGVDPCTVPVAPSPDGSPPNFDDRHTTDSGTVSTAVILLGVTTKIVAARAYVNWGKLRLSDYFTFVAYVLNIAFISIFLSLHKYHRHQWNIPVCWIDTSYLKRLFAQTVIFGPALFFAKATILLLYLEIFGHNVRVRRFLYGGLVFSALLYSSYIPFAGYYNAPHAGETWNSLLEEAQHIDSTTVFRRWSIAVGVWSALLDLYIFILPLVLLRGLNVSRAKKIQLVGVFGLALLGVFASFSSLSFRVRLYIDPSDTTELQAALGITNMFEDGIAIIIGSAPALAKFCRDHIATMRIWGFMMRSIGLSNPAKTTKRGSDHISKNSWPQPRTPYGTRPLSHHTDEYELLHSQIEAVRVAGPSDCSSAEGDGSTRGPRGITKTVDIVQYSQTRPGSGGKSV